MNRGRAWLIKRPRHQSVGWFCMAAAANPATSGSTLNVYSADLITTPIGISPVIIHLAHLDHLLSSTSYPPDPLQTGPTVGRVYVASGGPAGFGRVFVASVPPFAVVVVDTANVQPVVTVVVLGV